MSLTSFIDQKEVGERLERQFSKPPLEINTAIKAEPKTENYALIGTAFDYLFRFWLEYKEPDARTDRWVSYNSLDILTHSVSFIQPVKKGGKPILKVVTEEGPLEFENLSNLLEELDRPRNEFQEYVLSVSQSPLPEQDTYKEFQLLKEVFQSLTAGEGRYQEYLDSGELNNNLLKSTIDLAKIDGIYRAGRFPSNLGEYEEGDLQDLRNLYQTIPEDKFADSETILLNPTFGLASNLVEGADADFIVDGTLVDIKTTKYLQLKKKSWHQIVGYAILADIARDQDVGVPELEEIGIYFSRHGEIWTVPVNQVYNQEGYEDFKKWFIQYAPGSLG